MNKLTLLLLDQVSTWVCGRDLWRSAQGWVALYERKDLSGAEKRARVLAASLVGFAIEAALQYLRRRGA